MQIAFKTETTCSFLIRNSFHQSVAFGREPKVSLVVFHDVIYITYMLVTCRKNMFGYTVPVHPINTLPTGAHPDIATF